MACATDRDRGTPALSRISATLEVALVVDILLLTALLLAAIELVRGRATNKAGPGGPTHPMTRTALVWVHCICVTPPTCEAHRRATAEGVYLTSRRGVCDNSCDISWPTPVNQGD